MAAVAAWQWFLAVFLVLGSAFVSATETALTSLGDARARQLVEAGSRRARMLRLWIEHPERVLSTILVGNTLMDVATGALAGDIAATVAMAYGLRPAVVLAVAAGSTTVVVLFFGAIAPKMLGKRYSVWVALNFIPFVYPLYWVFWPVSTGATRAAQGLFQLLGLRHEPSPIVTSEEIEYLIEMGTREGVLDEVKEELLNSVLEFADRVVKEVMVPRTKMVAFDRNAPSEEIVRIVTENPYSRIPVYEGSVDNVVGVLLVRDLIPELRKEAVKSIPLDRYLKPPFFVPEQMKISRLLKEMQRRKIHLAVVVDEFGGTSGLATLEDVIEEIVGEIQDEGDAEAAAVKLLGDGIFLSEASIPLRTLEDFLNTQAEADEAGKKGAVAPIRFPEGDYETLGGFVTATAGRVPVVGSLIVWNDLTFTIRSGDERRVSRVEISRRTGAVSEELPEQPAAT